MYEEDGPDRLQDVNLREMFNMARKFVSHGEGLGVQLNTYLPVGDPEQEAAADAQAQASVETGAGGEVGADDTTELPSASLYPGSSHQGFELPEIQEMQARLDELQRSSTQIETAIPLSPDWDALGLNGPPILDSSFPVGAW